MAERSRTEQFLINILWGWLGVVAALLSGLLLTPYIISKLGESRYGIWALAFAFIEYLRLLDFGTKAALVHYIAQCLPDRQYARINQGLSTVLFYSVGLGAVAAALLAVVSGQLWHLFTISPDFRNEFEILTVLVGLNCALALPSNVFQGALEALQKFKAINRILILNMLLRGVGSAVALYLGYGLVAMGWIVVAANLAGYAIQYAVLRRVFPEMRISPRLVENAVWKQTLRFGRHTLAGSIGTILTNQGPLVALGNALPEAYVGYYTFPNRLLQYGVELVTRIGFVTMPNTAEMAARKQNDLIASLGMLLNRYCVALFLPLSLFLWIWGRDLISVWVSPAFAAQAAPLVPAFTVSTLLAVAGQFNSSMILVGLARHNWYGKSLIAEGVVALGVMAAILPRYGILGAAWVAAVFAIANRALLTPALLCRVLDISLPGYLRSIYVAPLLTGLPWLAFGYWLHATWLPGRGWIELAAAGALLTIPYYISCYFTVAEPHHRELLWNSARRYLGKTRVAA